jgi:hypothetical protein
MGAGQHVDDHRIDPELGHVQVGELHVRGRIPNCRPRFSPCRTGPSIRCQWPSMSAAARGSPSLSAVRIAVEDTAPLVPSRSGANGDVEAQRAAEGSAACRRAGPALAKAEIRAHDHVADAKPTGQHVAGERLGREARETRVEGQFGQHLDAQLLQPVGARLGVHQAEGRGVGGEELAGMRLERHDAKRCAGSPGQVDHMGMAPVHTIEIADRHRGAAFFGAGKLVVAHDPHGAHLTGLVGGGQDAQTGGQSNLPEGARTIASPFSTTVSSTRQWVASVTRRRP